MADSQSMQHQQVVVLDTNVLHLSRLYLRFADDNNLPPIGSSTDDIDIRLKNECGHKTGALENMKKGKRITFHLKDLSISGIQIEYPPLICLELLCGLLRGRSLINAAHEGMPHRMWHRIDEFEILKRLGSDDYNEIQREVDEISSLFSKAGIVITETNTGMLPQIWWLAQKILGVVFFSVDDCIIYSTALLLIADEIKSSDGYLQHVVNAIENPGGCVDPAQKKHFEKARTDIIELVSQATGINSLDVHLPKASKIR